MKPRNNPFRRSNALILAGSIAVLFIPATGMAADALYIGSAGNNNLTTGSNWVGGIAAGDWDRFIFGSNVVNGLLVLDNYNGRSGITLTSGLTQNITINGPQPLIMGAVASDGGIDMSSAGANLTINTRYEFWGAANWNVGAGRTLTINGGIAQNGAQSLTKTGDGTATIASAASYTGGTTVNGGILVVNYNTGGSAGSGSVSVNNNGSFQIWAGNNGRTLANNFVLNSMGQAQNRGAINQDGGAGLVTLNGSVTLAGNSRIGTGGTSWNSMVIAGQVTGGGKLFVYERHNANPSAQLTLTNSLNNNSGGIEIEQGRLVITQATALGSGPVIVTGVNSQLLVDEVSGTISNNFTLGGGGNPTSTNYNYGNATMVLHKDGMALTLSGGVTLAGNAKIRGYSSGGTTNFGSPIGGTGNLTFEAGGAHPTHTQYWVLGGSASTFTGNTLVRSDGSANSYLKLNGGALPSGTVLTLEDRSFAGGNVAVFDLNGQSQTLAGLSRTTAAGGLGSFVTNTSGTASILTINASSLTTFGGVIGVNTTTATTGIAAGGNNIALVKSGASTLTLTGTNSYTGTTTVNAGRLVYQNTYASPSHAIAAEATLEINVATGTRNSATTTFSGVGTFVKSGAGTLVWGGGAATFALGAGSLIDVQGGTFTGGNNANEVWTNNLSSLNVAGGAIFDGVESNVRVDALTGAGTIQSGYNGAGYVNFTFGVNNGSGTFSGVLANSQGAGSFVKTGSGTQTLSGTNTYTGGTTVTAGTLALGHATDTLAGAVTVNGGTLAIGTNSDSVGAVTLTSGSITGSTGVLTGSSYATTNGTISAILAGNGALTQSGAGTTTLSAANTYTGNTTVGAGTLSLSSPYLADASTLTIATGATLNLNYTGTDIVASLDLGGSVKTTGTFDSTNSGGLITGTGKIQVGAAIANFASWATAHGITGEPPSGDFDKDGLSNLVEYALGLEPTQANGSAGTFTDNILSFTKGSEAFANGDLTYEIETSTTLETWSVVVANNAAQSTISYTLPTGLPKEFARLKVTGP